MSDDIQDYLSSKDLTRALECAGDAIEISDAQGRTIFVNAAFETQSGFSRSEVIGKKAAEVLRSPEESDELYVQIREATGAGKVWKGEFLRQRKDTSSYPVDVTITPITDQRGSITHFVTVSRDLSSSKKSISLQSRLIDQLHQSQKLEAIGRLAGGVAHDFNNILMSIMGFAEYIQEISAEEDEAHEDAEHVKELVQRGSELTRKLLAFSRQQPISPVVLDLNRRTHENHKMLDRIIREDIKVATDLEDAILQVFMDPTQLDQIILNLVVNAQNAMPRGGHLKIQTRLIDADRDYSQFHPGMEPGQYVRISVMDTGKGMDKETISRIFEPFFSRSEGTGLGLATVWGIVTQNKGTISVYSEVDSGATFHIHLPCAGPEVLRTSGDLLMLPFLDELSILLVEDDHMVRRIVCRMLQKQHKVVVASGPDEAIAAFEKAPRTFDLLLTDVIMPSMNGQDLYERLRLIDADLKVLYMSGYTADIIESSGAGTISIGKTSLIHKPFTALELNKGIKKVLALNRLPEE